MRAARAPQSSTSKTFSVCCETQWKLWTLTSSEAFAKQLSLPLAGLLAGWHRQCCAYWQRARQPARARLVPAVPPARTATISTKPPPLPRRDPAAHL